MTKSRRQIESKDVSLLARPSYEDIEERRKRL